MTKIHSVVLLASLALACEKSTAPSPIPTTQVICTVNASAGSVAGCGNVSVTTPAATPTPNTGANLQCSKGVPLYEQNLILAEQNIPANQSPASYGLALSATLKAAGFKTELGGSLPGDEIAVKITDAFSETYDYWRGPIDNTGTPQVLYSGTCTPARF